MLTQGGSADVRQGIRVCVGDGAKGAAPGAEESRGEMGETSCQGDRGGGGADIERVGGGCIR